MFWNMSERMILAVDWDVRQVRLVHAGVRRGAVRIDRLLSVGVPAGVDVSDPPSLGKLIREVLGQEKIGTKRVILDVPRDQALLTTLRLPVASPDEMPALVEFQIAKEIPFPLADAVVDFAMLGGDEGEGQIDVLVGTVRREVVTYYQQTCAAAGLTLERLGLRPYANKVAVNELFRAARHGCAVLVDVGPRLTEIDVISAGKLAFSRAASVSIPRPGAPGPEEVVADSAVSAADDEEAASIIQFPSASAEGGAGSGTERVVEALLVEVTRSIEAYRATAPGVEIDMMVVAGSVGAEDKLAEALRHRFGAPVELYNPAPQFGWPEERGQEARGFAAALGLVSGHAAEGGLHFDFLHPKRAVTAVERRLKKAPAVGVAAAVLVAVSVAFYLLAIAPKKTELTETRRAVTEIKKSLTELRKIEDLVIATAASFEADQIIWLDELNRLCRLMPDTEEMVLTRLDMYHKGARIVIPSEVVNRKVAINAVERIDDFRPEGRDRQYFNAEAGAFTEKGSGSRRRTRQQYPMSGSIEVVVLEKVER